MNPAAERAGSLSESFDPRARRASRPHHLVPTHGYRATLAQLPTGTAEDFRRGQHERTDEQPCDVFQVCLPYRGFGVWHVGRDEVIADANQVLFVRGGESFRMSGPTEGGYGELIITPELPILAELLGTCESRLFEHPLFRSRATLASPRVQSMRTRFLQSAVQFSADDALGAEEAMVAILRGVFSDARHTAPHRAAPGETTARLLQRTKHYLTEHMSEPLRLPGIGRAVGASPAHLTTVFTRHEGTSLHQYLTRLRLAAALSELPHAGDLSALAMKTGFANHSHFTAAFRRAYGFTPSAFRETLRIPPTTIRATRLPR